MDKEPDIYKQTFEGLASRWGDGQFGPRHQPPETEPASDAQEADLPPPPLQPESTEEL